MLVLDDTLTRGQVRWVEKAAHVASLVKAFKENLPVGALSFVVWPEQGMSV